MNSINQKKEDYYTICKITETVFQINMHNHVFSYLIIGSQKALLIDTGWGTVDIKSIVESLTSLPLIVVNTHGHLDHIFGNHQFNEVFIKQEDALLINFDYTREKHEFVIKRFGKPMLPSGMSLDEWIDAKPKKTSYLNHIKHFDLGDRMIEIFDFPGHTKGSIGLLDKKERLFFGGDSVLNETLYLHFNLSTKLSVFLKSIENLIALKDTFDLIYPSHPIAPIEPDFLIKVKNAIEQIVNGEKVGEKREVFGRLCLVSDFNEFSVTYREDSI